MMHHYTIVTTFRLKFIFEKKEIVMAVFFVLYPYRKLRMSHFQNLSSAKNEFYYVKGKRKLRTNRYEQGSRSSLDISKQVQLSKHELSNMRRSQVCIRSPPKLVAAFSHDRF
jgi:hypothetical protein